MSIVVPPPYSHCRPLTLLPPPLLSDPIPHLFPIISSSFPSCPLSSSYSISWSSSDSSPASCFVCVCLCPNLARPLFRRLLSFNPLLFLLLLFVLPSYPYSSSSCSARPSSYSVSYLSSSSSSTPSHRVHNYLLSTTWLVTQCPIVHATT